MAISTETEAFVDPRRKRRERRERFSSFSSLFLVVLVILVAFVVIVFLVVLVVSRRSRRFEMMGGHSPHFCPDFRSFRGGGREGISNLQSKSDSPSP